MWYKEKLNSNLESISIHLWTWTTRQRWLGGFGVLSANKKQQFLIYFLFFFKLVSTVCKRGVRQCSQCRRWGVRRKENTFISEEDKSRLVSLFTIHSLFYSWGCRRSCGARWRRPLSAVRISTPLREWEETKIKAGTGTVNIHAYSGWTGTFGFPAEMPPLSPPAGRAVWSMCVPSFTVEISKRSWIIEGDQKLDARC